MISIVNTEPAGETRVNRWPLWLAAVLLVILFGPTLIWLWDRWTMTIWHHAHGLLILAIVVWLIRQELRAHRDLPASSNAWGFAILIPALLLYALDAGMHTQLLSAMALILALPGLALLFLGTPRTLKILFPLVFLVLTLPIPLAATEQLHLFLREVSTVASAWIVPRLGIPVFVEATTLHIPAGSLYVADACSGFSTLYASIAIACLVAYMCPDYRRRVLVLLAAAPVAVAANVLRVVLLVVLVQWQGMDILDTSLHTISGLLTFVIALPIIFWLGHVPTPKEAV